MVEEIGEDRIAHVQHAGGGVGIQAEQRLEHHEERARSPGLG